MVEPQPSKLMMWVRFPSPAPACAGGRAHIAQLVEHFLGKEEVTGSTPVMGSRFRSGAKASPGVLVAGFMINKR